jgi:hypothetical protein
LLILLILKSCSERKIRQFNVFQTLFFVQDKLHIFRQLHKTKTGNSESDLPVFVIHTLTIAIT